MKTEANAANATNASAASPLGFVNRHFYGCNTIIVPEQVMLRPPVNESTFETFYNASEMVRDASKGKTRPSTPVIIDAILMIAKNELALEAAYNTGLVFNNLEVNGSFVQDFYYHLDNLWNCFTSPAFPRVQFTPTQSAVLARALEVAVHTVLTKQYYRLCTAFAAALYEPLDSYWVQRMRIENPEHVISEVFTQYFTILAAKERTLFNLELPELETYRTYGPNHPPSCENFNAALLAKVHDPTARVVMYNAAKVAFYSAPMTAANILFAAKHFGELHLIGHDTIFKVPEPTEGQDVVDRSPGPVSIQMYTTRIRLQGISGKTCPHGKSPKAPDALPPQAFVITLHGASDIQIPCFILRGDDALFRLAFPTDKKVLCYLQKVYDCEEYSPLKGYGTIINDLLDTNFHSFRMLVMQALPITTNLTLPTVADGKKVFPKMEDIRPYLGQKTEKAPSKSDFFTMFYLIGEPVYA